MSGVRTVRPSWTMSPRRPRPCGALPMSARASGVIPLVMKRSNRPRGSAIPSAAYRAPMSPRTRSTMSWSTRSMSSSAATARVAASSAARRSARPCASARDQAASTAISIVRTTTSTAPAGASRMSRPRVSWPSWDPSGNVGEARPICLGRQVGERPRTDHERRQRWRADLEHRALRPGNLENPLERLRDGLTTLGRRVALPALERIERAHKGKRRARRCGMLVLAHRREPSSPAHAAGLRSRRLRAIGP